MRFAGLIVAIMLVLAGGFSSRAAAQQDVASIRQAKILKSIDDAWKAGRYPKVREYLGTITDNFESQKVLSQWGRQNYTNGYSRDPHIGFLYAEALQKMAAEYRRTRNRAEYYQGMDLGLASFVSSQIIAFENVALCDDKAVGEVYLQTWLSGDLRRVYESYLSSLKPEQREAMFENALKIVDTRNLDRKDRALCASGADALARAQLSNECQAANDRSGEACKAEAHVKFVSDEAWKAARLKIQNAVKLRVQEGKL